MAPTDPNPKKAKTPKKAKPSQSAASQAIKQYLDKTNRPWSVTNIVDSLAPLTGLNATGAKAALQELGDTEQIDLKVYGKQIYYLSKQSQYPTVPEEEVKKEMAEIARKQDNLAALKQQQRSVNHELSAAKDRQTDAELNADVEHLRSENNALEQKLQSARSGGGSKLTKRDITDLEASCRERLGAWTIRKRVCKEMVGAMCEGGSKTPHALFDEIGMESDELAEGAEPPKNAKSMASLFDDSQYKQIVGMVKAKAKAQLKPRSNTVRG